MASDLRDLVKVREVRAELAQNEASRLLKVTTEAQAALDDARNRQQLHLQQAAQASAMAGGEAAAEGRIYLSAVEAQWLLDFAAASRAKAREAIAAIRRAELVRERAKEASDAAHAESMRLSMRRDTVASHADRQRKSILRRKLDREEETVVEEQATTVAALHANHAKDQDG